jgi:transcriptional regulator with PAS, ATPase and Fis domain
LATCTLRLMHPGRDDQAATLNRPVDDLEQMHLRSASLVVVEGPDAGHTVDVDTGAIVIGSGAGCDLRLADELVSRRHVEIRAEAAGVRVLDRGSRNGTFVEGMRVYELLVTSDLVLHLGQTRIALRLHRDASDIALSTRTRFGAAIALSGPMRHVFQLLEQASRTDVTVLLEGESGTGKEVLATSLHQESARKNEPFVVVDCGAIPVNLVESELFGHERGAFTGAVAAHAGAFEQAQGGTVFLDEIGELPLEAQPKLLRALEARTIRRVGGAKPIPLDVRIVAATNRCLKEAVRRKEFRADLYYRLAVVHVRVPRLAERKEDIAPLAESFLRRITGDAAATLPADLLSLLSAYDWPGNARELRNVVERFATFKRTDAALLLGGNDADATDMPDLVALAGLSYEDAKRHLLGAYHKAVLPRVIERAGSVSKAAEHLGLSRASLYRILQEERGAPGPARADD